MLSVDCQSNHKLEKANTVTQTEVLLNSRPPKVARSISESMNELFELQDQLG